MVAVDAARRWLWHWLHAPASRAFPPEVMREIEDAIDAGGARHDAEICFAVEACLPTRFRVGGRRIRARAETVFGDLKVGDTARRTGILIYVLLGDYTIEIIPDRGVAARVPDAAWERIAGFMSEQFRGEHWKEGALAGIEALHNLLELYLPPGPGRRASLPDVTAVL